MITLNINLAEHSYPIVIGNGALAQAADRIKVLCPSGRAAVVSDRNVWDAHGELLKRTLGALDIDLLSVVVEPGEKSKSPDTLFDLYRRFTRFGLKRSDPVIAFGGGVVGDLCGFAAATYMRGLPFIQIPTTLLAQVDSSVGGKVAVNLEEGKNLVGSFYQPRLVIADTSLLMTLPAREWRSGMAEVVKYAAIGEGEIPSLIGRLSKEPEALNGIVHLCCKCKARFVERDERDNGERMMLNFGHTFGHAIEKLHGYEGYNHGEAVAIGMSLAAKAGTVLGVTEPGTVGEVERLLARVGLDYRFKDDIDEVITLMSGDKKNSGDEITLVLLKRMGEPVLHRISQSRLSAMLRGVEL